MTTPRQTRPINPVSRTVTFIPQVFENVLYPIAVGTLRIGGVLIRNGIWLGVAVLTFLVKSLHELLEALKTMNINQNS